MLFVVLDGEVGEVTGTEAGYLWLCDGVVDDVLSRNPGHAGPWPWLPSTFGSLILIDCTTEGNGNGIASNWNDISGSEQRYILFLKNLNYGTARATATELL